MTTEYKELLLRDLCGRLPYMPKVHAEEFSPDLNDNDYTLLSINANKRIALLGLDFEDTYVTHKESLDNIKPYLRLMDSMTEEEKEEWHWKKSDGGWGFDEKDFADIVDWLNAHHLDWRRMYDEKENKWKSMIEMGIALPAPEGMYEF
jgi:hypothetical protein